MSLPIQLNSRSFIRNFKPHNYPTGTREGMDWAAFGGVWDDTDSRNVIYWGPPRPVQGDSEFQIEPAETPANCVRRLKMAGFLGLYSSRAELDKKRLDPPAPMLSTDRRGGLEKIAAALRESSAGRLNIRRANEEGRRPTLAERREQVREDRKEMFIQGFTEKIPIVVGVGNGTPEDIDEIADEDTVAAQESFGFGHIGPDDDSGKLEEIFLNGLLSPGLSLSELPATDRAIDSASLEEPASEPQREAIGGAFPSGRVIIEAADIVSHETEEDLPEEDETPVGGGGRAIAAPAPPPVVTAPIAAGKGKGLAGGGGRRKAAAPAEK